MWSSRCDKGISLIEVLIALFLISVGILALMSLQPSAWRTSSRSDFLGRAAMILHQELETKRIFILNENNGDPLVLNDPSPRTVYPSGMGKITGDVPFNVQATVTDLASSSPPQPNSWRVTVRVTWPGNPTGIAETIVVGRQLSFRWPFL